MKKLIWSVLFTLIGLNILNAQNKTIQLKVITNSNKEALLNATIYLEEIDKEFLTNEEGVASIQNLKESSYTFYVTAKGYKELKQVIQIPFKEDIIIFELEKDEYEVEEVVYQTSRTTRTIKRIPTRIEFIGEEELGEKVIMNASNISMVLRESTGIQMQQTSLSSGDTNIRIQGLDGRYTQLLRDGFPLYGGFSSGLSILQIPPVDLKQFEIVKGSNSTLYGGGAIAGLVNMVSKTPEEEPSLDLMFSQTQALGSTANLYYSKRKNKLGFSVYGSGHYQKIYDADSDHFSNLPKTKSVSLNPKIYYYPSKKTTLWLGLNGTFDNRIGGDIKKIQGDSDTSHQYTEENTSKRISSQFVYETKLDSNSSINFKNSISYFNRNLEIPTSNFKGNQISTFTEFTYKTEKELTDWVFGANLYSSDFNEDNEQPLQRNQEDLTYGIFANNIYDFSRNWILETGFRADYNTDFGFFPLPRISLLYKNSEGFSSRLGGGLGYKIPSIFTEEASSVNYENVLAIQKEDLKAERSYGVNFDINYQTNLSENIKFSVNQLFYVTSINNGLLLNSTPTNFLKFENATDKILSKGAETNIKFSYKDFRWFLNYAFINTQLNYLPGNPQKPLTAKHNGGSVLMYESEKWRIGYETYYTGSQYLSNGRKTTDFVTMGLLLMRNFKHTSVYMNFENFTDRKQSRFSDLVLPPHETPIFKEIYAPTDGFIFSVGFILRPFGNKTH